MSFGHEQLDVYQAAIEYVGWAYRLCEPLKGHRSAKEQLLRASQAIPLNIAEGNGKATDGDRRRYFEIARASALECGAIQDVLEVCGAVSAEENTEAKVVLDRIVAMLTKLGRRGYSVREEPAEYSAVEIDSDSDSDSDPEKEKDRTSASSRRLKSGAAHVGCSMKRQRSRRRREGKHDPADRNSPNGSLGFARQFNLGPASNRHAGESRHPDCVLVALLLDSGFRRNDESKAATELAGKAGSLNPPYLSPPNF